MSKVLIIGCGGVASVAIHKCCQVPEVFTEICIASRTKAKCDKLAAELAPKTTTKITTAQVDADKVDQVIALIKAYQPDLVMNIALPYQDLTIMDACLACGVNYMDTANYEPENTDDPQWRAVYEKRCKEAGFSAYFDYSWQWAYAKKFEEAGLTALLGSGFDPGVTQAYCAYAKKHEFDTIDTIDILDCNGGDHGYAFATNFNPEVNLREVSAPGSYIENGKWVEIGGKGIAVVTAVAVQDVDGVNGVELVLLGVGTVGLGDARVKAAAQQGSQAGFLELLGVGPLPAVIKVGRETGLLAALLVDGAPFGVIGVLRLVVGGVHVVDAAGKAGVHDGQVLIGQGDVHHEVGLVSLDEGDHLLSLVGVHLSGGDFSRGLGGQLCSQLVALCLGAAGNADLGKHFGHLAALVDGNGGHAAAADDQNFAHVDSPLCQ